MERLSVSIIVPVYNVEAYLHCCVDNVLNQSLTDFELILVDDGSTDNSGAICDEYAGKDDRVVVIHKKNEGQGKARNLAMSRAAGKYIIFLDSDDYWMPQTLETLYAEAERKRTQVLLFGGVRFLDGMKAPENYRTDIYLLKKQNDVVKTGPESLEISLECKEYSAMCVFRFYLSDYLKENDLRFDEGITHEDVKFSFLSYLFAKRVECIDANLYRRRVRPGSIMTGDSVLKHANGLSVCLNELLKLWLLHSLPEKEESLLERYCVVRAEKIYKFYKETIEQGGRREAKCIQRESKAVMKKAGMLPSLPFKLRLAACSPFLVYVYDKCLQKLRRGYRKGKAVLKRIIK